MIVLGAQCTPVSHEHIDESAPGARRGLNVLDQHLEPAIHVLLHVAVQQRQARIIGDEIHFGGAASCAKESACNDPRTAAPMLPVKNSRRSIEVPFFRNMVGPDGFEPSTNGL